MPVDEGEQREYEGVAFDFRQSYSRVRYTYGGWGDMDQLQVNTYKATDTNVWAVHGLSLILSQDEDTRCEDDNLVEL